MNELLRRLLNLPPQGSSVARGIDTLHYIVIGSTFAGVALLAAVTIWFVVRFRRRGEALTPRVESPPWFELGIGAALLAVFCAWWFVGFRQYRNLETPPANAMPVYVTAKQWMWKFDYPGGPTSTERLVVPVGQPVKLIMTARDVIHSFYVPAFRIKQDVVPGHATTAWFEATSAGTYEIMCTQYCGLRHSLMRGQVIALAPEDFAKWRAAATGLPGAKGEGSGLAERGRIVAAERGCLRCHSVDGSKFIGPTWANAFGRRRTLTDGTEVQIDEAYLTESMMDPNAKIAAGYAPVMPSYQGLLDPEQTGALLEYIRSLADITPTPLPAPTGPIHVE